jgi:hypothetical protein
MNFTSNLSFLLTSTLSLSLSLPADRSQSVKSLINVSIVESSQRIYSLREIFPLLTVQSLMYLSRDDLKEKYINNDIISNYEYNYPYKMIVLSYFNLHSDFFPKLQVLIDSLSRYPHLLTLFLSDFFRPMALFL